MSASAIACFSLAYAWSRSEAVALIGTSVNDGATEKTSVCVSAIDSASRFERTR